MNGSMFLGFVVSLLATAALIRFQQRLPIVDVPNERSSHRTAKPRTGGIAVLAGLVAAGWVCQSWGAGRPWSTADAWVFSAGLVGFTIGFLDDVFHLRESIRFLAETAFFLLVAVWGPRLQGLDLPGIGEIRLPAVWGVALTAFWYTGFLNLFNFMDGTDGLAAGEAVILGGLMSFSVPSVWPLVLSGAALGFLVFNRAPSRIFLGDGGSYLIGTVLAVLSVIGARESGGKVPFFVFILFAGTFISDTTVTLARRMIRGERWYQAHRSHYYQKLTDLGWSHAGVARLNAIATIGLGLSGFAYKDAGPVVRLGIAAFWAVLFAVGMREIDRQHRSTAQSVI